MLYRYALTISWALTANKIRIIRLFEKLKKFNQIRKIVHLIKISNLPKFKLRLFTKISQHSTFYHLTSNITCKASRARPVSSHMTIYVVNHASFPAWIIFLATRLQRDDHEIRATRIENIVIAISSSCAAKSHGCPKPLSLYG